MLPVAILAGGLATRLRPVTSTIPKSMVEVAGRPFIDWQLRQLRREGVKRVVLCVGHMADQIEDFVGNGSSWDLQVTYAHDGATQVGTGGAIRNALPLLGDAFFVLYGDSYLPISFNAIAKHFDDQTKPALMTVLRNQNQWDKSNVVYADGTVHLYDKVQPRADMHYIDYGLSIIKACCLETATLPQGAFDLATVFHQLSRDQQLAGYEVHSRFYEIGSPDGLEETRNYLKAQK